ncbi:MAG TPA: PAS domain S-box protein [Terriglobales bacterium]|nr:PAS domain S-box protein [Terriglobales bacterium]
MPRASQLLYDAFNASPIGIALEDLDGQPLFVNPSFCSMLGFTEEELRRKHCVDFSPPEDAQKDWALFKQLRTGLISQYQLEKRYYRRDGSLMWGRLTISLLKRTPPLILAMVEDVTEKKKWEESLRHSEERLRLAQQAARMGTFEWNIKTGVNTWTSELETMHGLPPGAFSGTQTAWENLVHADDRARVTELVNQSLKTGEPMRGEWRVVWPDGSLRWMVGRWQVFMDESGQPSRMLGVNIDVTERKVAEQALAEMTRKLIQAQEQERARIGRELHDDINQRLAMLGIELEQVQNNPSGLQSQVQKLRKEVSELTNDVQALSHDLHSSKLEYLGVVAGMKSWCKEFAERRRMEIDFRNDVSSVLPMEVGLTLLRILQESVQNATKHSAARRIEVQLREDSSEIHLTVADSGRGFDVAAALQGKGLGLTSMRERVRLVHGTISIDSRPTRGTTIQVRVPFTGQMASRRAVW